MKGNASGKVSHGTQVLIDWANGHILSSRPLAKRVSRSLVFELAIGIDLHPAPWWWAMRALGRGGERLATVLSPPGVLMGNRTW